MLAKRDFARGRGWADFAHTLEPEFSFFDRSLVCSLLVFIFVRKTPIPSAYCPIHHALVLQHHMYVN
jgi:hypothetical protein